MTITQLLFSFDGRIKRSQWWLVNVGLWIAYGFIYGAIFSSVAPGTRGGGMPGFVFPIMSLACLPATWISLAANVKRLHDRNKSGWFILIGLIPLIGGIWLLIELGFLDTKPDNKYGPSPKASEAAAAA